MRIALRALRGSCFGIKFRLQITENRWPVWLILDPLRLGEEDLVSLHVRLAWSGLAFDPPFLRSGADGLVGEFEYTGGGMGVHGAIGRCHEVRALG
jgi:hypothetical protein